MSLNPLLKDKQGKSIELERLAYYLGVSSQMLLDCFYGRKGWGVEKAVMFSTILKGKGYDFPPETFLSKKMIFSLNILLKRYGIKLEPFNPLK